MQAAQAPLLSPADAMSAPLHPGAPASPELNNLLAAANIEAADVIGASVDSGSELTVHYCAKGGGGGCCSGGGPGRRLKSAVLPCDPAAAAGLRDSLMAVASPKAQRKFMVVVNPVSGKRQGQMIWETKSKPIFDAAGIESTVVITNKVT